MNDTEKFITNRGYIKLHRKFDSWEWYDDANTMRLFIHCLIKANHETKNWRGQTIQAGSFVTSYAKLAYSLKLSEKQIRTALNKLKKTGEVAHVGNNQNSIITINNWTLYQQEGKQQDTQKADEGQAEGRQRATTKNDKNDNNDKKNNILDITFKIPSLDEIRLYCEERRNNVNPQQFFDYYSSNGWKVGKNKMKDWKASVRTWENNSFNTNTANSSQTKLTGKDFVSKYEQYSRG